MARELFVDTSGFYSLLALKDDKHKTASAILQQAAKKRRQFMTTDYVLDETATLLKARGVSHLLAAFFSSVFESEACRVQWTDAERFAAVRDFYLKHIDQGWSFTDCV